MSVSANACPRNHQKTPLSQKDIGVLLWSLAIPTISPFLPLSGIGTSASGLDRRHAGEVHAICVTRRSI
jgi:hypothetical protein